MRLERGRPVAGGSSGTNGVGTADKKGRGKRERSKGGRARTGGTPTGGLGSIAEGQCLATKKFEISGDQVSRAQRAKPRTPIPRLMERDTDTLARVDNI